MNHKEHLGWKRKQIELAESIHLVEQEYQYTQSCLRELRRTTVVDVLTAALQKKDLRYFNRIAQQQQTQLRSLQVQAAAVQQTIHRQEQEQKRSNVFLGGMTIIMIVALGLLGYLALQDGSLREGASPTSLAVSLTLEELQSMGLEDLDITTLDITTIPDAPALKIQAVKTKKELIKDRHISVDMEKVKSITPDGWVSEDIEFTDGRRMLNIHQPFIDGKSFSEALPLTAKDEFTYSAIFDGTALEIEFEAPEIQADAAGRKFAQTYSASNRELKVRYDYALPALNFTPRIRVSSSSAIEVIDATVGELHTGTFIVDFKAEQQNGYNINTVPVNPNIVYIFLSRNYSEEGKAVDEMVIIDPTLTISGTTTELCGLVTAYDIIDINTGGVLEICEANTTSNYGWVNISLGYFGNFSLDSSSSISGRGFGETGGPGNASSGGRGYSGDNGNNGTIGYSTASTPNGGGGGGGQKVAATDSAAGSGGGFGGGGGAGGISASGTKGVGGLTYGSPNSTTLKMGSGGAGGAGDTAYAGGDGGAGIKIVTGAGGWVGLRGTVQVSGNNGTNAAAATADLGGGGGGSGGHVIVATGTLNMASGIISADGGGGGQGTGTDSCPGGGGGGGRIYIVYDTLQSNLTRWTTNHGFLGGNITSDAACNNPSDALGARHGANGTTQMNQTHFDRMPQPRLSAPANNTVNTTDSTPNFYFNVSDDMFVQSFINCTLYVANATYPQSAPLHLASNQTVFNATNAVLTANSSLNNGPYAWWMNCSDGAKQFGYGINNEGPLNYNISETRNITISIAEVDATAPTVVNFWMNYTNGTNFTTSTLTKIIFNATVNDSATNDLSVLFGFSNGNGTDFNYTSTKNFTLYSTELVIGTLTDARYTVQIYANDTSNNKNYSIANLTFSLDRTAPTIANFWMNHSNASNFSSSLVSRLLFNATVNDSTLTVQEVRFGFYNGNATGFNVTAGKNSTLWAGEVVPALMSDGIYTVIVSANDTVDNRNNTIANLTFSLDRTAPTIANFWMNYTNGVSFSSPATEKITFNATVNDSTLTVQEVRFGFYNGNATGFNVTARINSTLFAAEIELSKLSDGTYTVILSANDTVDNRNNSIANITFIIGVADSTTPIFVSPLLPANLTVNTTDTTPDFVFNVTDDLISQPYFNCTLWMQNDTALNAYGTNNTVFNATRAILTVNSTLNEDSYLWWVNCSDGINTNVTAARNFTMNSVNDAPVITYVSTVSSRSIIEAGSIGVNISFTASDPDGAGNLDNASAQLRVNFTGETPRFNTSCTPLSILSTTTINYSCSVNIWYFDGAGNWTINASIRDGSNVYAENASSSFELLSTTAIVINPSALFWPTLELGTTNQTSSNDPITINNTGNRDIAAGGVTATGYNMQGVTTTTEFILATNFSVSNLNGSSSCSGVSCLECNGTIMSNATAEVLPNALLSSGNNSRNYQNDTSGQENLFFCLMTVPSEISRQTYNTAGANTASWSITVS